MDRKRNIDKVLFIECSVNSIHGNNRERNNATTTCRVLSSKFKIKPHDWLTYVTEWKGSTSYMFGLHFIVAAAFIVP